MAFITDGYARLRRWLTPRNTTIMNLAIVNVTTARRPFFWAVTAINTRQYVMMNWRRYLAMMGMVNLVPTVGQNESIAFVGLAPITHRRRYVAPGDFANAGGIALASTNNTIATQPSLHRTVNVVA